MSEEVETRIKASESTFKSPSLQKHLHKLYVNTSFSQITTFPNGEKSFPVIKNKQSFLLSAYWSLSAFSLSTLTQKYNRFMK